LDAYCKISFGWYAPLFYAHKLYLNNEEVTGEVVFPDGITSVSNVVFEGCTGITSVVIPEGVTSIGRAAFKSTNITSVSLPESLTFIGIEAFQDCSALTSVVSEIEEPFAFAENAFSGISSECVLTVPKGKTEAYIAQGWTEDVFKGGIIEDTSSIIPGDANNDGSVSIADVTAVINYINGIVVANFDVIAADVNGDGKISIADVTGIINIINN
jgi:hypothetical protein